MLEEPTASPIFKASFALFRAFHTTVVLLNLWDLFLAEGLDSALFPRLHSCVTAAWCPDSKQDGTGGWQG